MTNTEKVDKIMLLLYEIRKTGESVSGEALRIMLMSILSKEEFNMRGAIKKWQKIPKKQLKKRKS